MNRVVKSFVKDLKIIVGLEEVGVGPEIVTSLKVETTNIDRCTGTYSMNGKNSKTKK